MAGVNLRVNSQHKGHIRGLNKELIENLLPEVVEFVGKDPAENSESVVALFPDSSVEHFGKPPNT